MIDFLSNLPTLGTHLSDGVRVGKIFAGSGESALINGTNQYVNSTMPYGYTNGAPGVKISPMFTYRITPLVNSATCIVNNRTIAGGGYISLAAVSGVTTQVTINGVSAIKMDVPRNIIVSVSSAATFNAYIWGLDYGGVPMCERITVTNGTSGKGNKAFLYVTKVYLDQPGTYSVGSDVKFGLPYFVPIKSYIKYGFYNNIEISSFVAGNPGIQTITSNAACIGSILLPWSCWLPGLGLRTVRIRP